MQWRASTEKNLRSFYVRQLSLESLTISGRSSWLTGHLKLSVKRDFLKVSRSPPFSTVDPQRLAGPAESDSRKWITVRVFDECSNGSFYLTERQRKQSNPGSGRGCCPLRAASAQTKCSNEA